MRALAPGDADVLERFVAMSSFLRGHHVSAADLRTPRVRRWLDSWGEELGVGWESDGALVGAAWARRVEPVIARDGATGDPLPEVILGVSRQVRGQGVGRRLIAGLQARAAADGVALAAKVRAGNAAAVRVAEQAGFVHHTHLPEGRMVVVWRPGGRDCES